MVTEPRRTGGRGEDAPPIPDFFAYCVSSHVPLVGSLQEWMRNAGFTLNFSGAPTLAAWIHDANSMSPVFEWTRPRCPLLFFSESDARGSRLLADDEFLVGGLCALLMALMKSGPPIVVLTDGDWPARLASVTVIDARSLEAGQVAALILRVGLDTVVQTRIEESRRALLGELLLEGLHRVFPAGLRVLVFGPGRPRDPSIRSEASRGWEIREYIAERLRATKSLAVFGEDLEGVPAGSPMSRMNPGLKERLAAVEADAIVLLVLSHGVVNELGQFSQYPAFCRKTLIVGLAEHEGGFTNRGSMQEAADDGASILWLTQSDLGLGGAANRKVEQAVGDLLEGILKRTIRRWADESADA